MNSIHRFFAIALLFLTHGNLAWACTTPAVEIMQRQLIGTEYTLTKYGHYCQAGSRFATTSLAEAISLGWAEYSFQLTRADTTLDLTSLVGSQGRLNKFTNIKTVPIPTNNSNIIGLQFIATSSANIYSEIHIAEIIDSNMQPMAIITEPITVYQAQHRSGSEYMASGFYQLDSGQWLIDSIASSKETAECNACQKYDAISWLWHEQQLQEYSRRAYNIDSYQPLTQ